MTLSRLLENRNFLGAVFMLPAVLLLLVFLTYPLGLGTWLGFTDAKIGRDGVWVGRQPDTSRQRLRRIEVNFCGLPLGQKPPHPHT